MNATHSLQHYISLGMWGFGQRSSQKQIDFFKSSFELHLIVVCLSFGKRNQDSNVLYTCFIQPVITIKTGCDLPRCRFSLSFHVSFLRIRKNQKSAKFITNLFHFLLSRRTGFFLRNGFLMFFIYTQTYDIYVYFADDNVSSYLMLSNHLG